MKAICITNRNLDTPERNGRNAILTIGKVYDVRCYAWDQFEMMVNSKLSGEEKELAKHFFAILPFIYASVAPRDPQTLLDNMKGSDIMQKHPMRLEVEDLIELMYLTDMSAGRYGKDYYNDMLRHQNQPYSSLKGEEPARPRR